MKLPHTAMSSDIFQPFFRQYPPVAGHTHNQKLCTCSLAAHNGFSREKGTTYRSVKSIIAMLLQQVSQHHLEYVGGTGFIASHILTELLDAG